MLFSKLGLEGRTTRFCPIFIISLTIIFGMLSIAITAQEGSEMMKPIVIAVIGGLAISIILTLVVVPVIYSLAEVYKTKQWRPNFNPSVNLSAGKLFIEKKQKGGIEMLMELTGGLIKFALIKTAVLTAVCLVSAMVILAMAVCGIGKLARGCYNFLRTKIAEK